MVPNVARSGASFKGAFAYYLHDKRQEGEQVRDTSERVGWTETRNLATDDPELAEKIMIATAQDQDRLKAAAGIKNTGRKSPNSVYAYSIAWHPDEAGAIDKTEMLRAADESLRAIGAQDRQAVIIAHTDEPHPHVHVVVNRVSMDDGRMLSTSNDFRKLDAWALAYRRERGQEHLYCPARAEKAEAVKRQRAGEDVDFVRGEKSVPRGMVDDFQKAKAAANDNRADIERDRQTKLDGALGLETRSMHHRHKQEWADLSDRYRHKKDQIGTHSKAAIGRARDQIRDQYRPAFRDTLRRHHQKRRDHRERDQYLMGKLRNVFDAMRHKKVSGLDAGDRGWLASAFTFVWSRRARFDALDRALKAQVRELRQHERVAVGQAVQGIKDDRSALLSNARGTFEADRAALIARQADERKLQQQKWKQRNQERQRAFTIVAFNAEAKREAKAQQRPKSAMKHEKMRGDQREAAKGRKRSGRSRSRSRKRTRGDE